MHPTCIIFSPSNTQIGGKEQIIFISRNSNETEVGE